MAKRAADKTAPKQLEPFAFKPGQSGNPAGRPKGSRNKLSEAVIQALCDDFEEHGVDAIRMTREADPVAYVKVCASLLPKEFKIERVDELNDEQLDQRIRQLATILGAEIGAVRTASGEAKTDKPKQAGDVPAVH